MQGRCRLTTIAAKLLDQNETRLAQEVLALTGVDNITELVDVSSSDESMEIAALDVVASAIDLLQWKAEQYAAQFESPSDFINVLQEKMKQDDEFDKLAIIAKLRERYR